MTPVKESFDPRGHDPKVENCYTREWEEQSRVEQEDKGSWITNTEKIVRKKYVLVFCGTVPNNLYIRKTWKKEAEPKQREGNANQCDLMPYYYVQLRWSWKR